MNKYLINSLKFFIYLLIGSSLMWFVYRKFDMQEIIQVLNSGINYWWFGLSMVIGLLSHFSRTIRWQMLIEPIEKKTRISNTFLAVMMGYFANLLLPRMGEISRCGVLSRYEKISVSKLIGTVVVERLIDIVMLFVCIALLLVLQFRVVSDFLFKNTDTSIFTTVFTSVWSYVSLLVLVVLIVVLRKRFMQTQLYVKFKNISSKFGEGFFAVKQIKNKWSFIFHTVFIWVAYFFMIYVCFFGFEFTKHLSPMVGFSVFVLSSLGMVAPVQGGMGPWHFMVIASLQMYEVEKSEGGVFALIVWSALNGMIIIMGILSMILLPIINKTPRDAKE